MSASRTAATPFNPNGLLLPSAEAFGERVTIAAGANLTAGAVLGQITSGGKYALSASAANDGSQVPVAILGEDAAAASADAVAFVYYVGAFRESALTFGAGHTAAALRRALAQRGLQIAPAQATGV